MSKITIIGAGNVGATIAYTIASTAVATEVLLIDVNEAKAKAEVMDICQGIPFATRVKIVAGTYEDAVDSSIVIITSGFPRKANQSRLELAQMNVDILKDITPKITAVCPDAFYVIVSNPVDILTYVFTKISGVSEHKIVGCGTLLDTSRLITRIGECCNIHYSSIEAYVFGEHGDSSMIPWSLIKFPTVSLDRFSGAISSDDPSEIFIPDMDRAEIEEYVRRSGSNIIAGKGATFYAVATCAVHICKCLLSQLNSVLTVSTMLHGEYGIDDVCLSTLNIVSRKGVQGKVISPITDHERRQLKKSADSLKNVIKGLKF